MKLRRKTRLTKIGAPMTVNIGKSHKVKLYPGESIDIDLPDAEDYLTIKHSRQAKKIVTNQDQVTITDNPINLILFWSGVVLVLGSHLVLSFDSSWLYWLTIIGLSSIIVSYLVPRFKWIVTQS
ncbi:TPA: hypothetical protein TUW55_000271 [Streptococcus equi subsp. zooepidemicus]|nr:hypothetical protein [Streptococcus equi subsp. zooepidemicus]HEL0694730.1 hypothetical protein [Streptococcus equi subsp. zooepidemicus]HEL0700699.1 hypothetical protein [Streptococcus equi subsp. zooepidemicus]HEL0706154.1 hypothetical protein [Streptococcus equi subsp. zooepidemicus]HEL1180160.1 hypothetical protein [Streptococcus equi subsp. zooepidemicus]